MPITYSLCVITTKLYSERLLKYQRNISLGEINHIVPNIKAWKIRKKKKLYIQRLEKYHITSLCDFFFFNFYLFIYFWLCWVSVSVRGLSPVAASGGHSSSRCTGLSLSRPLLLRSTGSRRAGSVVVAHGLSCSTACGIFPDQGSNPCPLHWQADSQPLRHQGSPSLCDF